MGNCSIDRQVDRLEVADKIQESFPRAAQDLRNLTQRCEGLKVPDFDRSPEAQAEREKASKMIESDPTIKGKSAIFDLHNINKGVQDLNFGVVNCDEESKNERKKAMGMLSNKASPAVGSSPIHDLKKLNEFCEGSEISKFDMSPKATSQRDEAGKQLFKEEPTTQMLYGPVQELSAINRSPALETLRKGALNPTTVKASRELYEDAFKPQMNEINGVPRKEDIDD
jgi:hypothetical protein